MVCLERGKKKDYEKQKNPQLILQDSLLGCGIIGTVGTDESF